MLAFFSLLGGTTSYRLLIIMGLCISVYGLVMFATERSLMGRDAEQIEDNLQFEVSVENSDPNCANGFWQESPVKAAIALGIAGIAAVIATVAISSQVTGVGLQSPRPTAWFDFASLPPTQTKAWCPRQPLTKLSSRKETRRRARVTSAFDNVLLIVFFSHPRYDVNLDYHLEMYQDYFPNVSLYCS
jgi:hypothetical protein